MQDNSFNANNSQKQDIFLATLQIDLQRRHIITHANDVQIIWPVKFALPTPYASASALNSNLDKTLTNDYEAVLKLEQKEYGKYPNQRTLAKGSN